MEALYEYYVLHYPIISLYLIFTGIFFIMGRLVLPEMFDQSWVKYPLPTLAALGAALVCIGTAGLTVSYHQPLWITDAMYGLALVAIAATFILLIVMIGKLRGDVRLKVSD